MPLTGSQPELARYLHFLRRNLWIVVITTTMATTAAVFVSSRETRLFRSTAQVLLTSPALAASAVDIQIGSTDPGRQAETQADLARSPGVISATIRSAGSDETVESFLSRSTVSAAPNADILTFGVTDQSKARAADLVSRYATAYTVYRHRLDTGALREARGSIEKQLASLAAQGNAGSPTYGALLEKDQQLVTLEALQRSNALVIRATSPATQVQPKTTRNALAAVVLGFLAGIALSVLRDAVSTGIRTPAEVESLLDLPQLARIPTPPRPFRSGDRLLLLEDPLGRDAEPFWILATSLEFVNVDHRARTILFTSARDGEGKSTTVANLALALARRGRRVAVVDLDLRKPSLARMFHLTDGKGVTLVALGEETLEGVVRRVPLTEEFGTVPVPQTFEGRTVDVYPSGPPPPNPAEFVGTSSMARILHELESQYDFVLVDAPPLLGLSDAITVAGLVDAIVLVVNIPLAKRSSLREVMRVLDGVPAKALGFAAAGAPPGTGETYGYYRSAPRERPEREHAGG